MSGASGRGGGGDGMTDLPPGVVRVRVPASTANLGSGFDALGLALGLHDTVEVTVTDGGVKVEVTGEV